MKVIRHALLASVAASPLLAQGTRELDAHVHGVSALELAVEGGVVEMTLRSPGRDIVGFEYAASSDAEKDAVEAAIRTMLAPENIVALPAAAECRLTEALVRLRDGEEAHAKGDGHDHGHGHGHDGEAAHDDHDDGERHDDHAEGGAHAEGAEHSEFQVRYAFACAHPEALTTVGFPFFERFANAREIEAQHVTDAGAGSTGIGRDAPELTLK